MAPPDATVLIVTRNRREDLRRTLPTALAQEGDVEVLVVDNGSTDGTPEMVAAEFPRVRLLSDPAPGYIGRRNAGVRAARGDIVLSVDDDCEFTDPATVRRLLGDFADARVGAVAMPYVDHLYGEELRQAPPRREGTWAVDTFVGCAGALRRDAFLAVGGFREEYGYSTEEPDLCLRLLDAGQHVALGHTPPLVHRARPSPGRRDRALFAGRRGEVLLAFYNAPARRLVPALVRCCVDPLLPVLRERRAGPVLRGLAAGAGAAWRTRHERRPVSVAAYRRFRRLRTRGPEPLAS
jgi:GT2 family glycosyltransferase